MREKLGSFSPEIEARKQALPPKVKLYITLAEIANHPLTPGPIQKRASDQVLMFWNQVLAPDKDLQQSFFEFIEWRNSQLPETEENMSERWLSPFEVGFQAHQVSQDAQPQPRIKQRPRFPLGIQHRLNHIEAERIANPPPPEEPQRFNTIDEVFDRHKTFEDVRPQMKHYPFWYSERLRIENEELGHALVDNPTPEQMEEIKAEMADCYLFLIGLANRYGMEAADVVDAIHRKLDMNEERFPVELFNGTNGQSFKENYAEAKRREGRPIEKPVVIYESAFARDMEYLGEGD